MKTEILVVGAGPCGLVTALLAKQAGLSCLVIDKRPEDSFFGHAHYLNQYSLRILAAAGVDVVALAQKATDTQSSLQMAYCTTLSHVFATASCFSDPLFAKVWGDADKFGTCLHVCFKDLMAALLEACHARGINIIWECAFSSTQQSPSQGVRTLAVQAGVEQVFLSDWLLACDGARSSVANSVGASVENKTVWQHFLSVELSMDLSAYCTVPAILYWIYHPLLQACMVVHNVRDYQVLQIPVAPDVAEKGLHKENFITAFRALCGLSASDNVNMEIMSVKPWVMQSFTLSHFFSGQVVFLGDSAHAMTPAGGLGLNTALGDAVNLVWKLRQVADTRAPFWLSSYHKERYKIASENVQYSIDNYRDFTSLPRLLGYDTLWKANRLGVNPFISAANSAQALGCESWSKRLSSILLAWQGPMLGCRFVKELVTQAVASHLRHFKGLDQHLGFCYDGFLIHNPQVGLGDYTLDYDIVLPGRMLPSIKISMFSDPSINFLHELLVYPRWCLLSSNKGAWLDLFPVGLEGVVDCYCQEQHYQVVSNCFKLPKQTFVLIRPDGVVAFVGMQQGLISYLRRFSVRDDCGDGHGDDGVHD